MILQSLAGLPAFLVYFCTAIVAVVAYLFVYTRVTPHNEFQLIRDNDPAAAIALGLSLLGFTLPVVSAIAHSANVVDCLIWSAIALIVQIVVYFIVKIPVPDLSARIAAGELAAADLARAGLAGRRRAQRRLDDLLIMDDTAHGEFGKRRPVATPATAPVKRSNHVALLLMGTIAVGGGAYALMPGENCGPRPGVALDQQAGAPCLSRGSSSGSGGSWSSGRSFFSSDAASSQSLRCLVGTRLGQDHARRVRWICARVRVAFFRGRLTAY